MKVGYTEFSFGYAFTENLIRSAEARPIGAPFFPNLIQEAQLGYDVRIDLPSAPLFFQYKLPELMIRDTAVEIPQYGLKGIKTPFFRMPLMRRDLSQQHRLLRRLEKRFPRAVYYASPSMQGVNLFNAAYNAGQVHRQSVLFSPRDIGPLRDDSEHSVAYRNGLPYAWFCSDPREISAFSFTGIEQLIGSYLEAQRHLTLAATVFTIREQLVDVLAAFPPKVDIREPESPETKIDETEIRRRVRTWLGMVRDLPDAGVRAWEIAEELLVSREIARVGFGLEMLIAQPAA